MLSVRFVRLVLALLILLVSLPVAARQGNQTWRPRATFVGDGRQATVIVNNAAVMNFFVRKPSPDGAEAFSLDDYSAPTPLERAEIVTFRLNDIFSTRALPVSIRADSATDPEAPRLKAAGIIIATLSAESVPDALDDKARIKAKKAARLRALAQIEQWAANLRRALAIPGLRVVGEAGQLVPKGETRIFRVSGAARGPLNVVTERSAADAIVSVQANGATDTITVIGRRPGRDVITVEREGAIVRLYPVVKAYAATLTMPRTVEVTGSMVPAGRIKALARVAALNSVTLTPGARLSIPEDSIPVAALASGRAQSVAVTVQATGADMLPVNQKVFVPILNRPTPAARVATLLYSNNPERLIGARRLFLARLPEAKEGAARLLYHHQNKSGKILRFSVEAQNESDAPTRFLFTGGDAGPDLDTVWVGYRAGADFVDAQQGQIGVTLELPPHSRMILSGLRLPDGLTVSGLMQLRVLSGPPPLVKIAVTEPNAADSAEIAYLARPLAAERIAASPTPPASLSIHVYAEPLERVKAEYKVGGRWTFVAFGKKPRRSVSTAAMLLYGDYGVTYDIAVRLSNPTAQAATARFVFEPSAGLAGGVFLIGDRRVEIPRTDMPTETFLREYRLAPGEVRDVHIQTLPLSGSNYPATLIVRP